MKTLKNKVVSFFEMIRLLYIMAPLYALQLTVLKCISIAAPIVRLYAVTTLIQGIESYLTGESPFSVLMVPIGMMIIVRFVSSITGILSREIGNKCNLYIKVNKYSELIESIATLEYKYFENRDTMDVLKRLKQNFTIRIVRSFSIALDFLETIVTAIILISIITSQIGVLGLSFFFVSFPLLIAGQKSAKNLYEADCEAEKHNRYLAYLESLFTSREAASERCLFKTQDFFIDKWEGHVGKALHIGQEAKKKMYKRAWTSEMLTFLAFAFSIGTLCWGLVNNQLSYGLFIAIIIAIIKLMNTISYTLSGDLAQMGLNRLFIDDYNQVMQLEKMNGALEPVKRDIDFEKIEFDSVTFTYPNATSPTLKSMSFVIEKGKKYAFVGENGAGKSTIIKLLLRLYMPDEGCIRINGKPIETFSYGQLKGLCAVVFQDYSKYPIYLKEALCLGLTDVPESKMTEVLRYVGLDHCVDESGKVKTLEFGKLSENGIEFSEGQWQRLSIARALISDKAVLVLDEATASIDPIRERELYDLFKKASVGKTTVFITHRLGSTKFADVIYVIKEGGIHETGDHDHLMASASLYKEMYTLQSRWYQ